MKLRCWICVLWAMILAATALFTPPVMAEEHMTLVREVALSPGNWMRNHYLRMSAEYRKALPYEQFLDQACYLKDRTCTLADWKRVPKMQKIYIPAEPIMVRVNSAAAVPAIALVPNAKDPTRLTLALLDKPLVTVRETVLATEVRTLMKQNIELRSQNTSDKTVFDTMAAAFSATVLVLTLAVLFLWTRLSAQNTELERFRLQERDAMRKLPGLAELSIGDLSNATPSESFSPPRRLPSMREAVQGPIGCPIELVFHGTDWSGSGHATDNSNPDFPVVYLLDQRTHGFTDDFKKDFAGKHFLALVSEDDQRVTEILPAWAETTPLAMADAADTEVRH